MRHFSTFCGLGFRWELACKRDWCFIRSAGSSERRSQNDCMYRHIPAHFSWWKYSIRLIHAFRVIAGLVLALAQDLHCVVLYVYMLRFRENMPWSVMPMLSMEVLECQYVAWQTHFLGEKEKCTASKHIIIQLLARCLLAWCHIAWQLWSIVSFDWLMARWRLIRTWELTPEQIYPKQTELNGDLKLTLGATLYVFDVNTHSAALSCTVAWVQTLRFVDFVL